MTQSDAHGVRDQHLFQRFFRTEAAGGALLLASALLALAIANSPWAGAYDRWWDTPLGIHIMDSSFSLSLHQWVNDVLMSVFFLLVGLEIKRELLAGELSTPRQAILPLVGAIGGMVVPAAVYLAINHGDVASRGWGIPMATDIAFALGTLILIAPTIPLGARVFLTALSIVDDMGAVVIIAVFYTRSVEPTLLAFAFTTVGALALLNMARVRHLGPYILLGTALWLLIYRSGIHATVAGVLLAWTIPTRTRINAAEFSEQARAVLDEFDRTETGDLLVLTSKGQQEALHALSRASEEVTAPLLRLEHALQAFCAFIVMPLFAIANGGVTIASTEVNWRVALGIALGLLIGKPLGITAAVAGAVKGRAATLPPRVSWTALHGCAWVGGIGFTMSLFIATLAFGGTTLLDSAKIGILCGSAGSGAIAALVLRRVKHV